MMPERLFEGSLGAGGIRSHEVNLWPSPSPFPSLRQRAAREPSARRSATSPRACTRRSANAGWHGRWRSGSRKRTAGTARLLAGRAVPSSASAGA